MLVSGAHPGIPRHPGLGSTRHTAAFGGNAWVEFHAALALFSYGVFALLALTSIMYLLQTYSLKRKHLHGLFSFLPSILELDHICVRLLVVGVVLMTWSLAVGSVHWVRDFSSVDLAKLLITAGVWTAYSAAMVLRLWEKLVSQRLAWACVALFAIALLSLARSMPAAILLLRPRRRQPPRNDVARRAHPFLLGPAH